MKHLKVALAAACAVVVGWVFTASADGGTPAYEFLAYAATPGGTGSPRINTEVVPAKTMEFRFKYAMDENNGNRGVFGSYAAEDTQSTRIICNNGNVKQVLAYFMSTAGGGGTAMSMATGIGEVIEGYLNLTNVKLNAVSATLSRRVGKACTVPMHVFAAGPTSAGAKSRFWYFSALDNGVYTRHYLPCRRTSDGVVGLWDVVGKSFVEPTGGALTAGPVYAGYRIGANDVCQFGVVATAKGKGTVAVNGGEADASASVWSNVLSDDKTSFPSLTATVTATPAEGWRFACWTGDVGGLTAAEQVSPQLTVTTDKPLGLRAVFHFDFSANAYIHGGLIAQWDGIENAGPGAHDPNATTWSNLVQGTSYNWSLASGKYVWEADAVNAKSSLSTSGWLATMTGVKSIDYTTFETYVQPEAGLAKTTGSFFRQNGRKGNIFLMPPNVAGYYGSANKVERGANLGWALGDRFAVSLGYKADGSDVASVYKDGVAQTLTVPTYQWAVQNQNMSIGGISATDTDYVFKGRIHTIRLYNRQLTAAEVAVNANIDKVRFEGADPSELTWPTGFRFNGEKLCIETLLELAGADGATVSLDNETFETATNGWFALNQPVTLYAKPVAGQSIAAWQGLPDGATVSDDKTSATFVVPGPISVAAVSHAPMTLRWRGGADSALASDAANWVKDDGMSAAALPPQSGDAVHFDKDSPSMTWDLDEVTLASWTQDEDFVGTNTFMTGPVYEGVDSPTHGVLSADGKRRELVVTGDITLNGGVWKHTSTPSLAETHPGWISGEGVYRLIARAGGDFTIGENASVLADNAGFRTSQGPGKGGANGASHGGGGKNGYGDGHSDFVTNVYGRIRAPLTQGSGAVYSVGGGSIELSATGDFTHDGKMSASMTTVTDWYTGSAGSIYIKAATLTGKGSFASTSRASRGGSGAGGRMAFVLTGVGATFDGYTGSMTCYGSSGSARSGTIYLETPADRERGGVLLIRGNGATYTSDRGRYTPLCHPGEDYTFAKIVLTNVVMLAVGPGITLKTDEFVSYRNSKNAVVNFLILAGGTVEMPEGYCFKDLNIRNDFTPSVLKTVAGEGGTLYLTNGVTCTIDHHVDFVGTLHMYSGSKVDHTAPDATDSQKFRANFSANEFILDSGASVNLQARGFGASKGPGAPKDEGKTSRCGSHGGLARDVGSVQTYGSITRPTTLGSGGNGYAGGGATHIVVKHKATINGSVQASGDQWYYNGAGGSVWIEAGSLEGASTGVISANAIQSSSAIEYYCGGGGRVAVTLTDAGADFSKYLGVIQAKGPAITVGGKRYSGGYGTVYLRKGGEAENEGTLIVDGDRTCVNADNFTDITMDVTENTVGHVVVTNGGNLRVRTGASLNVRRSFKNVSRACEDQVNGEASDGTLPAGTIAFVDPSVEATVTGTNVFMCLKCAEPGKTVRFGSTGDTYAKVDASGSFDIAGADGTPVCLRGLADATPWLFELRGKANVVYADVKDSNATPGDKVSVDDTNVDSGNNQNWGFLRITPGETITWTGSKGAAWGTADNWDLGRAPVDTDVIVIPAGCDNMPELMEPLVANKVTVAAGAALKLNTFSLTVTNGLNCSGEIVCSGTETLTLAGDVTVKHFTAANSTLVLDDTRSRSVDLGGQSFNVIDASGAESVLSFLDGFSAKKLTLGCTAAKTVTFWADRTVTVGEFAFSGVVGNEPALTLKCGSSGEYWELNVTGKGAGSGAIVSESHAVGQTVFAYNPSRKEGTDVTGWVFGVSETTWTGGASGNWSDPSKWSGGAVPDENSCVHFTSDATVTLDVDDATAQILDISHCTVNLKGAKTLTVTSLLEILDGGTLSQNSAGNCIHVDGVAYIRSGGKWTHAANGSTDAGYGVFATVDGDFTIDKDGAIDCYCKGYNLNAGPGCQSSGCHGGRQSATAKPCYGSMFEPTTLGSGGAATDASGGGRVRLTVGGTLTVDGTIEVRGLTVVYPGSSGSIWLTVGQLKGSGHVSADGSNRNHVAGSSGCGGRVAIYLTAADDLSSFEGKVSATGGHTELVTGASPEIAAGTVYVQGKDMEDKHGTVFVDNGLASAFATSGGADLPVTNVCTDVARDYLGTTVAVDRGGALYLTQDVTIRELELTTASRVNLNGHVLTIRSWAHKKGRGWPANWQTAIVYPGADEAGNPGRIVWEPRPLAIIVR